MKYHIVTNNKSNMQISDDFGGGFFGVVLACRGVSFELLASLMEQGVSARHPQVGRKEASRR